VIRREVEEICDGEKEKEGKKDRRRGGKRLIIKIRVE
jgi:hypothetical protein